MSRPNTFTKLIASILVFTIVLTAIPNTVYALTTIGSDKAQSEESTQDIVETISPEDLTRAKILCELTDNRTEYSKEYVLNNGHHVTVMYPEPVHYHVNGSWKEIDNTLVSNAKSSENTLTTRNSPFRVEMPSNLASGKEITVSLNSYSISFALDTQQNLVSKEIVTRGATIPAGEEKVLSTSTVRDSLATVRNNEEIASDSVYDVASPTKTYSGLTYNSVFAGVNLKYDLSPYTLKETIVINSEDVAARSYSFTLNAGALTPTLLEDGSIILANKETGEEIFILQAPYLLDANEQISKDIEVILTKELSLSSKDTNTWTITYNLPAEWMDNAAYPVMLDPIVQAKSTILSIEDVAVAEKNSDPETFAYNVMYMRVGKDSYYGRMRSFVKFKELPALTAGDVVTYAALRLVTPANTSTSSMVVSASKVTSSWNSHTNGTSMAWATQPSISSIIEDYQTVKGQGEYLWNVTDIAREWYQTGTNNGIALTAYNESASDVKKFYSSDNDGTNPPLPMLFIYHVNTSGLESYWDYTTVSANRAGVGYVNNFSGNLVWVHEDLGYATNTMPINIYHVYNSNDAQSNRFGMGYGWRTNYNQLVYQYTDGNYLYDIYVWEDEDGTRHYFEKKDNSNVYVDEANTSLEMTVTKNAGGTFTGATITDKQGNKSSFDSKGRLTKIENNQAESRYIRIYYDGNTYKFSYICDGNQREYRFYYNSSTQLLTGISYIGYNEVHYKRVNYTYDTNNNLTKITYGDGNKDTIFSYNAASHLMTRASQEKDYLLYFSYTTNTVGLTNKVKRVYEEADLNNNTSSGGRIEFTYSHNETTIQDKSGHINIYQFNYWGNTVCIQDDQGNASFASFNNNYYDHQNENNIANQNKKNQLDVSSQLQNTVGNRICEPAVRYPGNYWSKWSGTGTVSAGTITHTGVKSVSVSMSAESASPTIAHNYEEDLYVCPGESITFSAYVNTANLTSGSVYLALGINVNDANHSEYISTANSDWTRLEVTYTYLGTARALIKPYMVLDGVGTVYFDSLQLEVGKSASRLNLIRNSDLSYYGTGSTTHEWSRTSSTYVKRVDISTAITNGKPATTGLDNYVIKMTGNPTSKVNAYQTLNISGQAGDSYVFAGWAKGDSAPLTNETNRTFGIKVEFLNGTTVINSSSISFNPDMDSTNNWQYAAGAAVADGDYTSIKITLLYDYNVNVAYFDGIQLYKETFGSSFTYDDDGNVVSTVDANKAETEYTYNANNDLTAMVLPDDSRYEYTYDDYHNVTKATTPTGTVYSFEYDVYGNNTKVSVGTINNPEQMVVSATYLDSNLNCFDGAFLTSITDTAGNITTYGYDTEESLLLWVQGPEDTEDTKTNYTYDDQYRLVSTSKKVGNSTAVVSNTYTEDLLSVLTHTNDSSTDTTEYGFIYGKFDTLSSITVGGGTLASYTYNNLYERFVSSMTYGNGVTVNYTYDDQGRTSEVAYGGTTSLKYTYDQSGKLIRIKDLDANTDTYYYYDLTNRLMRYEVKDSSTGVVIYATEYNYNELNNLESATETVKDKDYSYSYTYNQDNSLSSMVVDDSEAGATDLTLEYSYDDLGRLTGYQVKENAQNVISRTIQYKQRADGFTTTLIGNWIQSYGSTTKTHAYTFDGNSNIKAVTVGGQKISYVYDTLGQLTRVNDQVLNETWTYTYDLGGNILSKKRYAYTEGTLGTVLESISYGYTDSDWSDLLTSYNGNTITYDQIGNTLSDGTWEYTWENGRQLARQTSGANTVFYTYDANGQRLTKESGNLKYYYTYDGITLKYLRVAYETSDDTICEMYFQYGQTGLEAIQYIQGSLKDTYYVVTNLQGDVIGLVDGSGTEVVSYTYDAWGNLRSMTGSLASTVGQYNPIRYRGYVYDNETGFYYLNSRYYNPEWGRFINADIYVSTGQGMTGANMFAYCGNDPANREDVTGKKAIAFSLNFSAAFVGGGAVSYSFAVDTSGNIAIQKSTANILKPCSGGVVGTPSAATTVSINCYDKVDTVFDLEDNGVNIGGSSGYGGDLLFTDSMECIGASVSVPILSTPWPEAHIVMSTTETLFSFNPIKTAYYCVELIYDYTVAVTKVTRDVVEYTISQFINYFNEED